MQVSVRITFADSTGAVLSGKASVTGLAENEDHIETIRDHCAQAVMAMGFHPETVREVFGIEG